MITIIKQIDAAAVLQAGATQSETDQVAIISTYNDVVDPKMTIRGNMWMLSALISHINILTKIDVIIVREVLERHLA